MTNAESKYRPVFDTVKTPDAEINPNFNILNSFYPKKEIFKESETSTNFRKEIGPCLFSVVQRFSTGQGSIH